MKVFLSPAIALHSPAMVRIANALAKYLPSHYEIVSDSEKADLCVFYPVSYEWRHYMQECLDRGQEYALIQCCYKSSGGWFNEWKPFWDKAVIVWSYLNLAEDVYTGAKLAADFNYYEAPLGIDEAFTLPCVTNPKRDYIVTTGTVHGNGQEAILECWQAARECGLGVVHVGQYPQNIPIGLSKGCFGTINLVTGCTDRTLRGIYQNAKYVCSLRYVEGFELPALEALSCGTRSIVFTQHATTKWFFGYADFVPESSGQELIDHLVRKFSQPYDPITQDVIDGARTKFNWRILAWRFWSIVEKEIELKRKVLT